MNVFNTNGKVSVRAYKGDAMSLLAFDLIPDLTQNLAGFTIRYGLKNDAIRNYIYNRLTFSDAFIKASKIPKKERNSTLYSPIQKFNWLHVPIMDIDTQKVIFGDYIYEITPRYITDSKLLPIDPELTVAIEINVSPFEMKKTKIGFSRGFVSSVAFAKRFNEKRSKIRPNKTDLCFDIKLIAGTARNRWDKINRKRISVDYTFEEVHKWLGWQVRERIFKFLDEFAEDSTLQLKVFAYDLDEPEICKKLFALAEKGKLKIILDNAGDHKEATSYEEKFVAKFNQIKTGNSAIVRGHYQGLAHCKVFIMLDANDNPLKVLTGSTNFSTNGIYINSNHVLIFDHPKIACRFNNLFENSFSEVKISNLKGNEPTKLDYEFSDEDMPKMTITFAPHLKADAQRIFNRINTRIMQSGNTDVLFAIMQDSNESSILTAIHDQLHNPSVFTYGITDKINEDAADYEVFLYKPNSINGIRVAARGIENILPKPFGTVPKINGYAIHHKFIVVNFRGTDPVVYCGSSNLAFNPEQANGDNLLEIHDEDIVTAFAIEALRLVDHFHWRNNEIDPNIEMFLDDLSNPTKLWYQPWLDPLDLRNRQRKLYIS